MQAARKRKLEYKPLLYTTTIRNPERIKYNLFILKKFENQILTDNLATEIVGELIRYGLYRPMKISEDIKSIWKQTRKGEFAVSALNDKDILEIQNENPQKHKEAGFARGYPSRFATIFDLAKELGFVYFEPNKKIEFSELGNILTDIIKLEIDNNEIKCKLNLPEREQSVFMQVLARSQRSNPFVKVLNDNIPLVLLLQVIRLINSDPNCGNGTGIARHELPLVLFWRDNNASSLYLRIKQLREEFGYTPSTEVIFDICKNEIMCGKLKKFKVESLTTDYTDEFIRKMRMTGLLSLRGAGRFLDINHNEDKKVDYILNNYADYKHFDDEYKYFKYMSSIDKNLIDLKAEFITTEKTNDLLIEWLKIYDWNSIKKELQILAKKKHSSKDSILKLLSAPIRLEFLIALAIKSKLPKVIVKPNYSCDDTGLPTSTAGGNKGDIECFESEKGVLVEVTMSEGRSQTMMEIWPIERHLDSFIKDHNFKAQAIFIAPTIFCDSKRQIDFVKLTRELIIRDYAIGAFIKYLEENTCLYI